MKSIEERFLSYVAIDTQSQHNVDTIPSTEKQKDLGRFLVKELLELGMTDAFMDDHGYVYATLPANTDKPGVPTIGFLGHIDTTPDYTGANVKARVVRNYDGGDIVLNEELGIVMSPEKFEDLHHLKGHDVVVTDGTTLLGADDKAGIADIMDMLDYFYEHPEIPHGNIRVCFNPDEEVGNGPHMFDVKLFNADFAYTLDGGQLGNVCYQTFNAGDVFVTFNGLQTHPGDAKDKMVNAISLAIEFNSRLPYYYQPEYTAGSEGYYHLTDLEGTVSCTKVKYILRDHDLAKYEEKKETCRKVAEEMNKYYGEGTVELRFVDTYNNMIMALGEHMHTIETAKKVMRRRGIEPNDLVMRGGTDGAQISFMGLPCPNLCEGGYIAHSIYEHASLTEMKVVSQILADIVCTYYEEA